MSILVVLILLLQYVLLFLMVQKQLFAFFNDKVYCASYQF